MDENIGKMGGAVKETWPPISLLSGGQQKPIDIARKLRTERKFDEAIKILQEQIEKGADAEECSLLLADIFADMGDFERAVKVMNELIKSDPKNKNYYLKRSVFRFKSEDKEGALKDVLKAKEIDPTDLGVIKALVDVNASLGNYEEALKAIDGIKNLNYIDSSIHERKRNLLKLLRMREEADAYKFLLDAVKANAKEDSLLIAQSLFEKIDEKRDADYYEIGCVLYRKRGMPHKVIELGEEAIKSNKANEKMLRTLAFAYMDLHKFDKAIKLFEEIVRRNNEDPGVFADFAVAKLNSGDPEGALKEIEKAIKLDPYREIFYMHKGDIVARINGVEQAIEFYEKAVKMNPLNQDAYDRLENARAVIYRHAKKSDEKIFR